MIQWKVVKIQAIALRWVYLNAPLNFHLTVSDYLHLLVSIPFFTVLRHTLPQIYNTTLYPKSITPHFTPNL